MEASVETLNSSDGPSLYCTAFVGGDEYNDLIHTYVINVSRPGSDPLGIPAVFLYFLVRQRSRINPPTDKALKDLRGGQHIVVSEIVR